MGSYYALELFSGDKRKLRSAGGSSRDVPVIMMDENPDVLRLIETFGKDENLTPRRPRHSARIVRHSDFGS